jgi:23S rRNA (uracil1939-C5)-methyltransferase
MTEPASAPPGGVGSIVELRIDSLATGGEGVGREAGGRVVFVPRAAPGDLVRARLTVERKRWARGLIVEVLDPGPGRREPPCPAYVRCGGCALQHMKIEAQRASKRQIVHDTLQRIGGVKLDVPELEFSGPELGYRNRITLTLQRTAAGVVAGFRAYDDPDTLVDLDDCLLAEEPVRTALRELRSGWGADASRLPAGSELRITIRAGTGGEVALLVQGGEPNRPGEPDSVARSISGLASYVWIDANGRNTVLTGSARFRDHWQGTWLGLGPESFLQVNRSVSEKMDRFIDHCVGPRAGLRIADLYSGAGARGLRWARDGASVTVVESDAEACAAARLAATESGLDVKVVHAPVESASESYVDSEVVVVNPPRAGLAAGVSETLVKADGIRRMAYVSCDPAKLARDLARLSPAWRPVTVRAFDAFPQTAHVETVVWLERVQPQPPHEVETP